jgi:ABC-type dipeptide/oligopeptide/nickel transport system permease subunit
VRRFVRRPPAVVGATLALVVVVMAVFAPLLAPWAPETNDFSAILARPGTPAHLLGTDELGRDVLSRIIWGARASLQAGVLATLLAMLVAVPIGLASGYYRGPLDTLVMRLVDTLLAFPFLILAVGFAAIFGPSLLIATLAIGLVQIPKQVRIARGEVLSLREETFVQGAVADGASDMFIVARHIFPNVANTLLVQATVLIPYAILGESTLSFLGLGVQPPTPSWGVMLTAAQPFLNQAPSLAIVPGLTILVTTLSFNLLGDGLRDALDPRDMLR